MISITKILALLLVLNFVSSVPRHHHKRQAITAPQPSVDPQTIIIPNKPRSWNEYQCDCFCVCEKPKTAPAPTPSKPDPNEAERVLRPCYCCNGCCKPCSPQCCYYNDPPVVNQPSVDVSTERIVNPCCCYNDMKPCKPQCCPYGIDYAQVSKPMPVEPTPERIINPCCSCNDMKPGQPIRLPQCCYNVDYMSSPITTAPVTPAPSKPVTLPQCCYNFDYMSSPITTAPVTPAPSKPVTLPQCCCSYIDYSAMTPLPQTGSEMVLPANTIQTPTTSIVGSESVPLSDYWYPYSQETIIN